MGGLRYRYPTPLPPTHTSLPRDEDKPVVAVDPMDAYHSIAFESEIATCDRPGIGIRPSHELVDLIPGTNVPAYLGGTSCPNR